MKKGRILLALCLIALVLLPAFATAEKAVYQLTADETIQLKGESLLVDLAGHNLTVTGEGSIDLIDTANDTYEETACGVLTVEGTVTVSGSAKAPNGNTYVTIADGESITAHRLDMDITAVSLRTSAAGLYYKARYTCDSALSSRVQSYGVVLSTFNMPGADFKTEPTRGNNNCYTVASAPFASGVVATSGSVFNILKETLSPGENLLRSRQVIYANAYVDFGSGPIVADADNAGKTIAAADFTGVAYSLQGLLLRLDSVYDTYNKKTRAQVDTFCEKWISLGVDWKFENIGSTAATMMDNSNIEDKFLPGTTKAECPVCKKEVTWIPVYDGSEAISLGTEETETHYYLAEDVTYNGTETFFQSLSKVAATCFHLNGHNVTATQKEVFFGSNSRTSIIGNGIVTGYQKTAGRGAALEVNNSYATSGLHVYGGTYRKADNAHKDAVIAAIQSVGSGIYFYEDVTIEATGGKAVRVRTPIYKNTWLGVYGATINGDIELLGPSGGKTATAEFFDCKVAGTVNVAEGTVVNLQGSPVIQAVALAEDTYLNLNKLTAGTSVGIVNGGVFTAPMQNPKDYVSYFYSADGKKEISYRDDVLFCGVDFIGNIEYKFQPGTTDAVCPACEELVTWTPIYNDQTSYDLETDATQTHYYLAEDVTYNGTSTYFQSRSKVADTCFHLNGHNVTATKAMVFFGSNSRTNILGNGIVTGYQSSAKEGAALQINNYMANNGLHVYGGTYRKTESSNADAAVVCINNTGSTIKLYEDVIVEGADGTAIRVNKPTYKDAQLDVFGATIYGDVELLGAIDSKFNAYANFADCVITGNVAVATDSNVTLSGAVQINKLTITAGELVSFGELAEGAAVKVSASGTFTKSVVSPEDWVKCVTCDKEGEWIVMKNKQLHQGEKLSLTLATQADQATLNAAYAGKTLKYGDFHGHTSTAGADGKNSLAEWLQEIERLRIDFATVVDHRQSIHMRTEEFKEDVFIGGSEPGMLLKDSKAEYAQFDFSMVFADPSAFEGLLDKWSATFRPYQDPEYPGYRFYSVYGNYGLTVEQYKQLVQDVYQAGGIIILVHPKQKGYLTSDDPLDYYFGENSCLEIQTGLKLSNGDGGNMCAPSNEKAYRLWADLLLLGKKVWATAGSDQHRLIDASGLNAVYTAEDHRDHYIAALRSGNTAPGWVGIRMNIGDAVMGGQTDFTGKRLVFSVGDIYTGDAQEKEPVYQAGHKYRVELYDESGLLMDYPIDPAQMNYFALDCDANAKLYRVVVWDDTAQTRVGVSNPIWNNAN